jgi:hypothetical protein
MLEVTCPNCRQPVKFAEEIIGKSVRCFSCEARFTVEQAGPGEFRTRDVPPSALVGEWIQSSGGEMATWASPSLPTRLEKISTATKITAVAACIIAICVLALTVAHFIPKSPKSEGVDEKMARYRKVCDDYERVMAVKFRIDEQRAAARPKTFAEEKEIYERLYREAGVDRRDVDRLFSEKVALARELGIREAH